MLPARRAQVIFNFTKAMDALDAGDDSAARGFADRALKFINWDEEDPLPYARHVSARDAFLKESGFPTLAVALVYIESWRRIEDDLKKEI